MLSYIGVSGQPARLPTGGVQLRYLITGGAGFIGRHLALRLADRDHSVVTLDPRVWEPTCPPRSRRIRHVRGSVTDQTLVRRWVRGSDGVFHLASVVGPRRAMERGLETLSVSYLGTQAVLEAASAAGVEVFVASSSAVYGKSPDVPVSEQDDYVLGSTQRPCWIYAVGKLVEEHLALAYARERGARVKLGRFFNVVGPLQNPAYGMVVPTFVRRALRGEPLPVFGDGRQTRTFVYVEDALDGLDLVMTKGAYGSAYNIGGTDEVTILDLARRVTSLAGSSSPIVFVPHAMALGPDYEETQRRVPDIAKLRGLGYEPSHTVDAMLNVIIEHYRGAGGQARRRLHRPEALPAGAGFRTEP